MVVRNPQTQQLTQLLWKHVEPICQIPNLAIHLTSVSGQFSWDDDAHLRPIIATTAVDQIMTAVTEQMSEAVGKNVEGPFSTPIEQRHMAALLQVMATEITIPTDDPEAPIPIAVGDIVDFDLSFYDVTPPQLVGVYDEFVSSPRLDNMVSSICASRALAEFGATPSEETSVNMVICFDHEECGSQSYQGAKGTFLKDTLERIFYKFEKNGAISPKTKENYKRAVKDSLLISADMGHGWHPNYSFIHQSNHTPVVHEGIMFKISADQKYTTDAETTSILYGVADAGTLKVPVQELIVK